MTEGCARRLFTLVTAVAAAVALPSCGPKEEPPSPAANASIAPPPTTAAPATTLPPPPTTVATPPPVWRDARWGMTAKEVTAAFPEAKRLPHAVPFPQPQMGSSLTAGSGDVGIASYETDGATFRVLFGFAGKPPVLSRIHLDGIKPKASTCEDVERAIADKHPEKPQRAKVGSSLAGDEVTWKLPDQTIVLTCAGVASLGFLTVTVDYLPPAAVPPASEAPPAKK